MCLILFAYQRHPRYGLVLAANRDEFYARPTAPLDYWADHPQVLAGRDLEQQGTWLGVTRHGRLAAITNYRDPKNIKPNAPSRGHLVSDFLIGALPPGEYLQQVSASADRYNGFNLLVGDADRLFYFSNRGSAPQKLEPGLYGISNHLLDTDWPKTCLGKQGLAQVLETEQDPSPEKLFHLLQNQAVAPNDQLPDTGISKDWEQVLSAIFIASPHYGTRSSSVLLVDTAGGVSFDERTWKPAQDSPLAVQKRHFRF
ncbi:MAG: NRDE family protein [Desulfatitalea sp.]|nr:NRDE family protein [Desulfatitalea sp.]